MDGKMIQIFFFFVKVEANYVAKMGRSDKFPVRVGF